MKYKVIIWGCGKTYNSFSESIFKEVYENRIDIVGFTGLDSIYAQIDGKPFIDKKELVNVDFDYIVASVSSKSLPDIYHEAKLLGIERNRFIRADVFSLPGFNFEQYIRLRQSQVSIISQNCFGGFLYNRLDLQFLSPTINMAFSADNFIRFCNNLEYYLSIPMQVDHWEYQPNFKFDYPVVNIDDVQIFLNHSSSFAEANEKWLERRNRVNFENILVIMRAESPEMLKDYSHIPYRKVCFTSFRSDEEDTYYVARENNSALWEMINGAAKGTYPIIAPLKLMMGDKDFIKVKFK